MTDELEEVKQRLLERNIYHKKMIKNGYRLFKSQAAFSTVKVAGDAKKEESITDIKKTNLVAIIGDRFMNGGFVSVAELEKCYKKWEGTLHDINHMGTHTGFFLMQSDITYFIGYHRNVKFDKANKSVSMELVIHNKTKFAQAWEGFVELCEMAGQIPNVSVTYYGKQEFVLAKNLPPEADWEKEGYGKDDLVPVLVEIKPVCVSTVLEGRCNDKDGCGIRNALNAKCGSTSGECDPCLDKALDDKLEERRQELIKRIKELEKSKSED